MNDTDTTTRTMSYAARFLALNAAGASADHLVDADLTETTRFTVQTRRVGDGPNGVPQSNLPTEWWDHDTFDTLNEALTIKDALIARTAPGNVMMGREFRVRATRTVTIETVEIY